MIYDRNVMTDMVPKSANSLDLSEAIKTDSIIYYPAATNDTYDILNHLGGIICSDFERNN